VRPYAPSLRGFSDPEGEILTYDQVRRLAHPLPAEQLITRPGRVTIIDPQGDAEAANQLRIEARFGL
jgi:hypothetical protein